MKTRQGVYIFIMVIFAIACVALRTTQLLFAVDAATGYERNNYTSSVVLYVLISFAALFFLTSLFSLKKTGISYSISDFLKNGPFTVILMHLIALTLIITSGISLNNVFKSARLSYPELILPVSGILFAVFLLLTVYKFKAPVGAGFKAFTLIPTLWGAVGLVSIFINYISIANISSQVFELIMQISFTLALFYIMKTAAIGGANRAAFCFGLCAVFFCMISSIPQLILFNRSQFTAQAAAIDKVSFVCGLILNVLLGLYILTVLAKMTKTAQAPAEEELQTEAESI